MKKDKGAFTFDKIFNCECGQCGEEEKEKENDEEEGERGEEKGEGKQSLPGMPDRVRELVEALVEGVERVGGGGVNVIEDVLFVCFLFYFQNRFFSHFFLSRLWDISCDRRKLRKISFFMVSLL